MTIYERFKKANVPVDSHESDLYAKVTPESKAIVNEFGSRSIRTFRSNIDGKLWYDIPFAFDPFWEDKF